MYRWLKAPQRLARGPPTSTRLSSQQRVEPILAQFWLASDAPDAPCHSQHLDGSQSGARIDLEREIELPVQDQLVAGDVLIARSSLFLLGQLQIVIGLLYRIREPFI